jgi:GNAT superfamily N-acetyltransferase
MVTVDFFADPAEFLAVSGEHLAAQPVVSTVVATIAERAAAEAAVGVAQDPRHWYAVTRDEAGEIVGAAMRTAPFEPRPLFVLPMPEEAASTLARSLHERGEEVGGANGALPAARTFAEETARLVGAEVRVAQHTRLFELGDLVRPERPAPGTMRPATDADLDVVRTWFDAFMADADEQAGRAPGASAHEVPDDAGLLRRIATGRVWLWEDDGEVVHLTAANPPAYGVARVGPVYTPKECRGRGYASTAVAEVSALLQAAGERACLFTDQANPTSNAIYQRLGYRALVDMANLVIT